MNLFGHSKQSRDNTFSNNGELDPNNDWYNEDCQTRLETLKYYDKDYYSIQDDWNNYFENYLITNIPDEYVQMIYQLERNINV